MTFSVLSLPHVNACLNSASAALLTAGWFFIRAKKIEKHRFCMVAAFVCSTLFLASYLYYHYHVGSVRFTGQGPIRTLYFSILLSHTVLAVVIVPMIVRTFYLAANERFLEHAWWARRTLPLWLYVSATGVVVYAMLYRL